MAPPATVAANFEILKDGADMVYGAGGFFSPAFLRTEENSDTFLNSVK